MFLNVFETDFHFLKSGYFWLNLGLKTHTKYSGTSPYGHLTSKVTSLLRSIPNCIRTSTVQRIGH